MYKKQTMLSFLSTLLLLFPNVVQSQIIISQKKNPNPVQITQNTYPKDVVDGYMKNCIQRAMVEELSREDAAKLCNCTMSEFQSRYNTNQFKKLLQASKNDPKAQNTLTAVGTSCFERILYE